jgi:hypothetical protein
MTYKTSTKPFNCGSSRFICGSGTFILNLHSYLHVMAIKTSDSGYWYAWPCLCCSQWIILGEENYLNLMRFRRNWRQWRYIIPHLGAWERHTFAHTPHWKR